MWLPTIYLINLNQYYIEATGASLGTAISVDYESKQVVWRQELRASFNVDLDFRTFPFDVQALVIEFVPRVSNPDRLVKVRGS